MWCADCQQDVPAVARSAREPLMCPRCQCELARATSNVPNDAGIALESFDQATDDPLAPPIDWLEREQTRERLREIDRKLSASYRLDSLPSTTPTMARIAPPPFESPELRLKSIAHDAASQPTAGRKRTRISWLLSILICTGVIAFSLGLGLLAWSAAFQLPQLWQQGMTLTIGAEGLLILSLTWMAARLWRNGRRVNRQLHGVDRQLADIEQITGALAGSQASSSQHYYHHFNQAASPHLLVANLQGQVDLMSARMASH